MISVLMQQDVTTHTEHLLTGKAQGCRPSVSRTYARAGVKKGPSKASIRLAKSTRTPDLQVPFPDDENGHGADSLQLLNQAITTRNYILSVDLSPSCKISRHLDLA